MSPGNRCLKCLKDESLCVCALIHPESTQLHVLILQHPQEPREALSSARLAHLALAQNVELYNWEIFTYKEGLIGSYPVQPQRSYAFGPDGVHDADIEIEVTVAAKPEPVNGVLSERFRIKRFTIEHIV